MGNKTISFFQVVEDKKNNKKDFIRVNSVEVLKIAKHELVIYFGGKKLVLTSNYDIIANCCGGDDILCLMFAYKPKSEGNQKLYPLPLSNAGFHEYMAYDRFEPEDSEGIKEKIMEDPEVINLVSEYKKLMDQMKILLEMSRTLQEKRKEIVKTILPESQIPATAVEVVNMQQPETETKRGREIPVISKKEVMVDNKTDKMYKKFYNKWKK